MLVSDALDCLTGREKELERRFDFLLRVFTPRTVFMEVGSADCGLALRAATYVERVWCIDHAGRVTRPPCNLRLGGMSAIDTESVDVAFSESLKNPEEIGRVLAPGGVYFIYGQLLPAQPFREAGFSRVAYYAGSVRVPAALAKISRNTTTAAYK
jgi:hypothetical protein